MACEIFTERSRSSFSSADRAALRQEIEKAFKRCERWMNNGNGMDEAIEVVYAAKGALRRCLAVLEGQE